ncbi:MAG: protein kinase [Candidatus Schekmanbacteria bacterium]|nr:protein kinase [Candidatus Schekmanbacteria bacterium]
MTMRDAPRQVDRYELGELLGRGGMGSVYRAVDTETGEQVALKLVRDAKAVMLQAVRREIRVLSILRHPYVVPIRAHGVHAGLPWYAMPLLRGESLRVVVEKRNAVANSGSTTTRPAFTATGAGVGSGSTPQWWTRTLADSDLRIAPRAPGPEAVLPAELPHWRGPVNAVRCALSILRAISHGLAYLHGEGLLHADLKPENIVVTERGAPVIIDFGLIRSFGGSVTRDDISMSGLGAGTLLYMAPEWFRGGILDARTDLYALGCLAYELLTGQPPITGRSAAELVRNHLNRPVLPPSMLNPGIDSGLDALVLGLLAKSPDERIGHAEDVADALARHGAELPGKPSLPPPKCYLFRPRLAGREEQTARIDQSLHALERGQGSVLLIAGDAGVGKSRMALEVAQRAAARGLTVLAASGWSARWRRDGAAASTIIGDLLLATSDLCREWGDAAAATIFGAHAPTLCRVQPLVATLPGVTAGPDGPPAPVPLSITELSGAIVAVLDHLTRVAPVAVVIDDLDQADPVELEVIDAVAAAAALGRLRLALVGATARAFATESTARHPALAAARRVELPPLPAPAVASMVHDMFGGQRVSPVLADFLVHASSGVPLFVAEFLHSAVAAGALRRYSGEGWRVNEAIRAADREADSYREIPLAEAVDDLLRRRFQQLPAAARRTAVGLAVAGRRVAQLELLGTVLGAAPEALDDDFRALERASVVEFAGPGGTPWFVHDRLGAMAYELGTPDERSATHLRAAQVLDAGDRELERCELGLVARHWELGGDALRAARRYLQAADTATAAFALAEAEECFRGYFRTAARDDRSRAAAHLGYAKQVLSLRGQRDAALAELDLAAASARHQGAGGLAAEIELARTEELVHLGRHPEAVAAASRAHALAAAAAEERLIADALNAMGRVHFAAARFSAAEHCYQSARDRYLAACDRDGVLITTTNLASIAHAQGDLAAARRGYEAALQLQGDAGNRRRLATLLINLGMVEITLGDIDSAQVRLDGAIETARATADLRSEAIAVQCLSDVAAAQGELLSARAHLDVAMQLQEQVGDAFGKAVSSLKLAALLERSGAIGSALVQYEQARAALWSAAQAAWHAYAGIGLARALRLAGTDLERASGLLAEATGVLRKLAVPSDLAECLVEVGHNALARGLDATPALAEVRALARSTWAAAVPPELAGALAGLEEAVRAANTADRGVGER